jgi:hypothetical protein
VDAVFVWLLGAGSLILGLAIFLILTLASEIGFRFGRWRGARPGTDKAEHATTATLTAGMIALLAFILGLTVNFAQNRFEARRDLVVTEANHIATAWLRARVVGGPEGEAIAAHIRHYAGIRLDFTSAADARAAEALNGAASQEADEIWRLTGEVARAAPTPITATLISALNEMFDSAQAQRFAFLGDAPAMMLEMMMLGAMLAIGAMGYESGLHGPRQPVLTSLLLLMWTAGMVLTLDLNRPRQGAIGVDPRPLVWTIEEIDHAAAVPATAPGVRP